MVWRWLMKLGLDVTEFQAGAKKAESSFVGIGRTARKHIGGELRGIGAAFAGMFTLSTARSVVSNLAQVNGQIKDMAENLGVSYERAQEFQVAVSKGPVAMGKVMAAILKMEALGAQAMGGDKRAAGLFAALGVDPSKGNSLDRLEGVLNGAARGVTQQAAAVDIVGKSIGGLKVTMQELKNIGPISLISTDEILRIDEAVKALDEAKRRMTVSTAPYAVEVMDMISNLTPEAIKGNVKGYAKRSIKEFMQGIGLGGMVENLDPTAGGVSTAALPLPDRSSAAAATQAAEAAAAVEEKKQGNDAFKRPAAGGLASSGGFFFDAPRRERQESVRFLRDIATATKKTADVITREVE
jgi:hypothetical protein